MTERVDTTFIFSENTPRNLKNGNLARDIDDFIYFKTSDDIISGEYRKDKITDAIDYDLIGEIYED